MSSTVRAMYRVSVFYPKTEGASFDHDYYRNNHVPLAVKAWSPAAHEIDKGVDGPYEAAVHFMFTDQGAFHAALGSPLTGDVMADVPNYTTIVPVMQQSEIV